LVFKRLALCEGAGGSGMSKGLLSEELIGKKQKSRLVNQAALLG
jgi:hypothetical protein